MKAREFLIVDDSENERQIMAGVLEDAFPHAEIFQASDASEAIKACERLPLECVLLDYNMPQVDGLELAGRVREFRPHLPLVLVTGAGDEMLVSHAMRRGITDYLPKGQVSIDTLQRTIERAILSCARARTIIEQRDELETFAYALAHDFKQPIRQMRTFTQLISEEFGAGGSERLQTHLGFLDQAASRLSNLVDVMSQYTLLSQPAELMTVDLDTVVSIVRESLGPYLEDRGGVLLFEGAAQLFCNETLLAQVLQNLVTNGLKYNKSLAPRVEVRVISTKDDCIIEVRDNGIGIEALYLNEIYRPLFRLHRASEYQGTGLGLTLARKAMLAQGGSIWCESKVGVGSAFFLKLPVSASIQAA